MLVAPRRVSAARRLDDAVAVAVPVPLLVDDMPLLVDDMGVSRWPVSGVGVVGSPLGTAVWLPRAGGPGV